MTTLKNIEKRSDEIIKMKNIVEQYRNQVEQLKSEIVELEKEVSETLDFEKDVELQEKKERLPNFEKRLTQAEKKSKEELRNKGLSLISDTTRYQREQMEKDEEVEKAYQTAKNNLIEAYKAVEAYEQAREKKADELAVTVVKAGYEEATNGLGLSTVNNYSWKVLETSKSKLNMNAHNQTPKQFFSEVLAR